ncbi:MAG: hypothetical protein QM627_12915 [Luteolibacter sp.]
MNQDDQAKADLETNEAGSEVDNHAEHDPSEGATDLDSYNKLVGDLMSSQAEAEEEEEAAEESQEEDGNGEEEEAESEEEADAEEEEEEEPDDEPKKAKSIRVKPSDEIEATAFALKRQNPKWSLDECLSKAKLVHGDEASAEDGSDPALPKSLDEAKDRLKELRTAKKKAFDDLEFSEAARLDSEIDDLRDHMDALKVRETDQQRARESEFTEAVKLSQEKAVLLYPATTDANSALVKRMEELDAQMQDDDNPLFYSPDKAFKLAQMAANDLGIAPRNPKAPAKPVKKTVPSRPVQPASGSARSSTPVSSAAKLDSAIDDLQSMDDYEKMVQALGVSGD